MSKHKKNILIAIPSYTHGGAEKHSYYTALALNQNEYNIFFLAFGKNDGLKEKLQNNGFETLHFPLNDFFGLPIHLKIHQLFRLIVLLRKFKFETIFSCTNQTNIVMGIIWKFLKVKKMYWHQWGVDDNYNLGFWEKIAIRNKPEYVANSQACLEYIQKKHAISNFKKCHLIHNTFDEKLLINNSFVKEDKQFNLIMIANYYPEKDHQTLIEAFSIFLKTYTDSNAKLFLLGSAPGISNGLVLAKSNAFDLGISNKNIFFEGKVNEIADYLSISDVGILSTRSEGLSNAILEYMAFELPVITTLIPQNEEALGDNSPNLFFEIGNVNECFRCIEKLYLDKGLRVKIGEINKRRLLSEFNNELYYKKINNLL